jgi:hypothetical protein
MKKPEVENLVSGPFKKLLGDAIRRKLIEISKLKL